VSFNGLGVIERCLEHVNGSRASVQVIVVDNGSRDGTASYLAGRADVTLIPLARNHGFGVASNVGIAAALARGADHVLLLNQDAFLQADTVTRLVAAVSTHPGYAVYSPVQLDERGDGIPPDFRRWLPPKLLARVDSGAAAAEPIWPVEFT